MTTKKEIKEEMRKKLAEIKAQYKGELDAMPKGRAGEVTEKTYEFARVTIGRFLRRLGYDWTVAEIERQAKELDLKSTPVSELEAKPEKVSKKK